MTQVAESLGLDVEQVKRANLYQQGDVSPTVSMTVFEAAVFISVTGRPKERWNAAQVL